MSESRTDTWTGQVFSYLVGNLKALLSLTREVENCKVVPHVPSPQPFINQHVSHLGQRYKPPGHKEWQRREPPMRFELNAIGRENKDRL